MTRRARSAHRSHELSKFVRRAPRLLATGAPVTHPMAVGAQQGQKPMSDVSVGPETCKRDHVATHLDVSRPELSVDDREVEGTYLARKGPAVATILW